jgi:hypothetical protein
MPDQTNITDFNPATGRTTTTLVSTHNRSPQEEAARDGAGHATWHATDAAPPGPAPTITSTAPTTSSAAAAAATVTFTGTNYVNGAKILVNGAPQTTTFISATSVSFSYNPTVAGTVQLAVRNPDGQQSANKAFVVAALADDTSLATIDEIKIWVDDHDSEADEILAAEQSRGSNARATLITWLEGFIAARDED